MFSQVNAYIWFKDFSFLFCISPEFLSIKEKTNINIVSYPPFYSLSEVAQSCPILCDPVNCGLSSSLSMGFSMQEYCFLHFIHSDELCQYIENKLILFYFYTHRISFYEYTISYLINLLFRNNWVVSVFSCEKQGCNDKLFHKPFWICTNLSVGEL